MFKIAGSALIILAAVILFSQKTFKLYFTYKFLEAISELIHKILYENSSNLPYKKLFEKLNFNADTFISDSICNRYINTNEISRADDFLKNLGKRDNESEIKYLEFNLNYFENKKNDLFKKYAETQKINILCGLASGIFISIILI